MIRITLLISYYLHFVIYVSFPAVIILLNNRQSASIIYTPNRLIFSSFFFDLPIRQPPSPQVYPGNVSCNWNSPDEYVRNQDP